MQTLMLQGSLYTVVSLEKGLSLSTFFFYPSTDKETQIRTDDYGRDLSTVQTLLTKQETFDAGLVAFANEGIKSITELKDQLIQAKHDQSEAIQTRYNDIIAKWEIWE